MRMWMNPNDNSPSAPQVGTHDAVDYGAARPSAPPSADAISALGGRAETLLKRVCDIEQALAVQEWWLLGRHLPEARILAEIGSLLAVARGELEGALATYFNLQIAPDEQSDSAATDQDATPGDSNDPIWVAARREQARALLRMIATALAPMLQYAQMLRMYAEQMALPPGAVDAFGIVYDRLAEIDDALRQPPQ